MLSIQMCPRQSKEIAFIVIVNIVIECALALLYDQGFFSGRRVLLWIQLFVIRSARCWLDYHYRIFENGSFLREHWLVLFKN